jgi:hypothetical protein
MSSPAALTALWIEDAIADGLEIVQLKRRRR